MLRRCAKTCLLTVVLAVGSVAVACAQEKSTVDLVPTNAAGFVHVNVEALLAAEQLELATDLLHRVDAELAEVFQKHMGVNALTLKEASLLLPPLEVAFENNAEDPAKLGFFTFHEAYDSALLLERVGGKWQEVQTEQSIYYTNQQGLAVLFLNDHTFLLGAKEALTWWLSTLGQVPESEPLVNALTYAKDGAAITVAMNTAGMPQQLFSDLPLPLVPFTESQAIILNVYIDQEIELFLAIDYATSAEAARARQNLRSLIDLGRTMLRQYEIGFEQQLAADADNLEATLGAVSLLALVRHADAHLQNVRVDREDYQLQADLTIDAPAPMLVLGAMTAIAAIGSEANEEFATVSAQLEGAE